MRALVLSGAGAGLFAHGGALDAIRARKETFGPFVVSAGRCCVLQ